MKKAVSAFGLICILFTSCQTLQEPGTTPSESLTPQTQTIEVVDEIIRDVFATNADFSYNTTVCVDMEIETIDSDTGKPISRASVNVYDRDGIKIVSGVTALDGKTKMKIVATRANDSVKVDVCPTGRKVYSFTIDKVSDYSTVDRSLSYKNSDTTIPGEGNSDDVIIDSDGDGIPDNEDDFPNDPAYAKKVTGAYTLAFEDLYPVKGDADFNDGVTRLTIEERINADNKVAAIVITAQALASGAGYHNQFGINVLSNEYIMIGDYHADLDNKANTTTNADDLVYVPAGVTRTNIITFDTPLSRDSLASMPYDPFMIPDGANGYSYDSEGNRYEVHLSFVETAYAGKVLDEDGFPWAIMIPEDWKWSLERTDIRIAYPSFQSWYESAGTTDNDWYLTADEENIYSR